MAARRGRFLHRPGDVLTRRDLAWFLLGAVLWTLAQGFSQTKFEFEPAIGVSQFRQPGDTLWWQSQFGFNGHLRAMTFEIGARWRFGEWGVAGRYAELGEANALNIATMRDDEAGRYDVTKPCDSAAHKNCLGIFDVRQRMNAVMLGVSHRFRAYGFAFEPELGQTFYQSHTYVSIWCPNCTGFSSSRTFTSQSEIRRSPYGALRIGYRNVSITYRYIKAVDGNGARTVGDEAQFATGLTHGPVNQILLGVTL